MNRLLLLNVVSCRLIRTILTFEALPISSQSPPGSKPLLYQRADQVPKDLSTSEIEEDCAEISHQTKRDSVKAETVLNDQNEQQHTQEGPSR